MRRLLFIKSETVQSSFEENKHLLEDLGLTVSTLPAISFRFKNIDTLRKCLEEPSNYSGLILTSGRSVEAVKSAIDISNLEKWKGLRNYCVGQTTERKITTDLGSGWTVRGGAETGNAEQLSELILQDLKDVDKSLPFLFPCSNLALGTIVSKLQAAHHRVHTIEVYETVKHEGLDAGVSEVNLNSLEIILFFSPSTVQYFLDSIRKSGLEEQLHRESLKLIAIGPSTRQEMLKQNLTVFACCAKPNIESLIEIIKGGGQEMQ